jgi:P27 family predicted phage terminase small subunit
MPTPRKSLAEHALHNTKPHYNTGPRVSHIPAGRPYPPKFLSADARKKFRALAKVLEQRRVATVGDAELLTQYCTLWERWLVAQQHVRDEGAIVTITCYTKNGDPYERQKKNPWLEVAQGTEKQMAAALNHLGLTVSSRDKAKQTAINKEKEIIPGSALDLMPELFSNVVPITRSQPEQVDPAEMLAQDDDETEEEPNNGNQNEQGS